jgi:hypothetical protein
MKKAFIGLFVLIFSVANAQEKDKSVGQEIKKGANATGQAVKKGAKAVGKKTSEVASKGKSKIVDKVYAGKAGPNGETIYINNKSQYYWVDKKGHRHYVTEAELQDKQA